MLKSDSTKTGTAARGTIFFGFLIPEFVLLPQCDCFHTFFYGTICYFKYYLQYEVTIHGRRPSRLQCESCKLFVMETLSNVACGRSLLLKKPGRKIYVTKDVIMPRTFSIAFKTAE